MLDLLSSIAANVLSLPGILGLAFGMMTRNPLLGAAWGALVGVAETLIFFSGLHLTQIDPRELLIAILVGAAAGCLGSLFRRKGATV